MTTASGNVASMREPLDGSLWLKVCGGIGLQRMHIVKTDQLW